MDKKRLIFVGLFLVVCVLLGYLLYRVFFAKEKLATQPATKITTPTTEFPTAEVGGQPTAVPTQPSKLPSATGVTQPSTIKPKQAPSYPITKAVDTSVLGTQIDKTGLARFYNQTDGKFYRLGKDGQARVLSDNVFYNVQQVTWSPTKDESIIEYPDGSNIYYNFETKKQVSLPKHWEDFSFSSLGDKIAAKSMGLSPENRWLITADPQGKSISLIEPMGENADQVTVDWSPNKQIVAMSRTGQALGADREEVLFVGLNKENFKSTIVEGRGFESAWSPDGKKLLYSVYSTRSDFKPELWIVNAEGNSIGTGRKMLNLNTWSKKCTFATERFIYCAVPKNLPIGAAFAPTLADDSTDQIFKIDIETGLKNEIKPEEEHTIDSLFVGDNGKTLYFTDKNSSGLYSLPL